MLICNGTPLANGMAGRNQDYGFQTFAKVVLSPNGVRDSADELDDFRNRFTFV